MSVLAALAVLLMQAAQPAEPSAPAAPPVAAPTPPAPSTPAQPTIDSVLDQEPITEDAREAAVKAAFAAAQARRGPLDGRWRLSTPDGQTLYIFQLADPGQSPDPRSISPSVPVIEGAWRDPRREGAVGGSGFLTNVRRDGADLILRFSQGADPARSQLVTLRLRPAGDWAGTLQGETAPQPVVMTRF